MATKSKITVTTPDGKSTTTDASAELEKANKELRAAHKPKKTPAKTETKAASKEAPKVYINCHEEGLMGRRAPNEETGVTTKAYTKVMAVQQFHGKTVEELAKYWEANKLPGSPKTTLAYLTSTKIGGPYISLQKAKPTGKIGKCTPKDVISGVGAS